MEDPAWFESVVGGIGGGYATASSGQPYATMEEMTRGAAGFEHHDDDDDDDDDDENNDDENHDDANHDDDDGKDQNANVQEIFRRLLREIITTSHDDDDDDDDDSNGDIAARPKRILLSQMRFPRQVSYDDCYRMRRILRREFRAAGAPFPAKAAIHSTGGAVTANLDPKARQELAFVALRKLNAKLSFVDDLLSTTKRHQQQQQQQQQQRDDQTSHTNTNQEKEMGKEQTKENDLSSVSTWDGPVVPLPTRPASSYLRPGTFLIAHPNLTGYFRRTVICILHHAEDHKGSSAHKSNNNNNNNKTSSRHKESPSSSSSSSSSSLTPGTYGLIVNRLCNMPNYRDDNDREDDESDVYDGGDDGDGILTFGQALDPLPDDISRAFGNTLVRDGGPVHSALQMLQKYRSSDDSNSGKDDDPYKIGGVPLDPHPILDGDDVNHSIGDISSTTAATKTKIRYRGDLKNAAAAVISQKLAPDDFAFFVGASAWSVGQLESEIHRGFWLPCAAPVSLAHTVSTPPGDDGGGGRGLLTAMDEYYLQFLAACGPQEAALANLVRYDHNEGHPFRGPSDDFT